MYTEKELKASKKADLIAICVANLIAFDDKDSKDVLIEKILQDQAPAEEIPAETPAEPSADESAPALPATTSDAIAARHRAIIAARRGNDQNNAYQVELARRRGQKLRPMNKRTAMLLELERRKKQSGRK